MLPKAGCHLILAHSPTDYVYVSARMNIATSLLTYPSAHALAAVELYTNLYAHRASDNPPTKRQLASQTNLINAAKNVLHQAEDMAEQYPEMADEEEVQQMIDEAAEAEDEEGEGGIKAADETMGEAAGEETEGQVGSEQGAAPTASGPEVMVTEATEATDEQSFPDLPTPPRSRGRDSA